MTKTTRNIIKMTMALFFTLSMTLSAVTTFATADEAMNPCTKANPCAKPNPCAKYNPCAKANPCGKYNPCGQNPCAMNPCAQNPCSPAEAAEISDKEAAKIYQKLGVALHAGYAKSGLPAAKEYYKWSRFNTAPYASDTHGGRLVNNYSNRKSYGKYEDAKTMTAGTILAKDSFLVTTSGKVEPGPLFLMEKMTVGYNTENGDWAYTLIMPDGTVVGTSKGKNAQNVTFCSDCHNAAEDQNYSFFMPEDYRK